MVMKMNNPPLRFTSLASWCVALLCLACASSRYEHVPGNELPECESGKALSCVFAVDRKFEKGMQPGDRGALKLLERACTLDAAEPYSGGYPCGYAIETMSK